MLNNNALLDSLGIRLPIIQAPMAGVSSPAMAAAVTKAGGLGSIGIGATNAAGARKMIAAVRERWNGALNVNVFCHKPASPNPDQEQAWIDRFRPEFAALRATPPQVLTEIYRSFIEDGEVLALLLDVRPSVVSFHFGLPPAPAIRALRDAGMILLCSVTSLGEARAAAAAGVHALVAQGWEAGGHRGVFDPDAPDDQFGIFALIRLLAREMPLPIIAAGGIMDGAGIAAALQLGASAVQLGTAFIGTDESDADAGFRSALTSEAADHTVMTRVISGRLARSLANRFTALGVNVPAPDIPDYPIAYELGKALHGAGKARGIFGYGGQWAGQGAPLARMMPAARLMETLVSELEAEIVRRG